MKSTLLFYLLSIMLSVFLGGMQVWHVFFPAVPEVKSIPDIIPSFEVPGKILDVNLSGIPVADLWNVEIAQAVTEQIPSDEESPWVICLKDHTWTISAKERPDSLWLFYGVFQQSAGLTAIFYNEKEKWSIVHLNEMFKGFLLTKINPQEITLREKSGKEWVLGLFELKKDRDTVKER